ncbi:MAG: heavy metal translocating P-type ATPase [Myxococcota bacterium]
MLVKLFFITSGLYVGLKALLSTTPTASASVQAQPPQKQPMAEQTRTTAQPVSTLLSSSDAAPESLLPERSSRKTGDAALEAPPSPAELEADRDIRLALTSGGLILAGRLFFSPLTYVGAGLMLAQLCTLAYHSAHTLVREKRVSFHAVDLALMLTILAGGYLGAASIGLAALGLSKKLAARTEATAHHKLVEIFSTQSLTARVLIQGAELPLPVEKVLAGDIVVVDAGQRIPIDGKIQSGFGAIDQRMLTGESYLVERKAGDEVFAFTVLVTGRLLIRAEAPGTETVAAQLGRMMEQTTAFKDQIISTSDEIGRKAALPTLAASGAAYLVTGLSGTAAILYTAAGYHLRFTGPISMLNFLQVASETSILIKDGRSLQLLYDVDTVIFDKTGTLTLNRMHVQNIHCHELFTQADVLSLAASAELHQSHPIAEAILETARQWNVRLLEPDFIQVEIGFGIRMHFADQVVLVGSARLMQQAQITLDAETTEWLHHCETQGLTPVLVAFNGQLAGGIEVGSTLRPEAEEVVQHLKARGLEVYIVSGDQEQPTRTLAEKLGIKHYLASASPLDKAHFVETLQAKGHAVCFVGDGINDALVLKKAQVSISLRGASTVATDAAQVVLLDGSLSKIPLLFELSRDFNRTMQLNVRASVFPAVITGLGVFVLNWGLFTSMTIYYAGFGTAMLNSIYPGLKRYQKQRG